MKRRRLQSETSFSRTSGVAVAGMAKCTQPCPDRDVLLGVLGVSATRRLGDSARLFLGCLFAQCLELRLLLLRQVVLQLDHQAELGAFDVALRAEDLVHFVENFRLIGGSALEQLLELLDFALKLELLVEQLLLCVEHVALNRLALKLSLIHISEPTRLLSISY